MKIAEGSILRGVFLKDRVCYNLGIFESTRINSDEAYCSKKEVLDVIQRLFRS